jgi:transcriptional regulator with XRE-family HTH domain
MDSHALLVIEYNMCEESGECLTPMDLRKRIGLTQVQLAARLGKSPSTVAKWEARSVIPKGTPSEIKRLCETYECTLDELIEAFEGLTQQGTNKSAEAG